MTPEFRTAHKRLANGDKRVYYYTVAGTRFFDSMHFQLAPPFPQAFIRAYKEAIEKDEQDRLQPKMGDLARFLFEYEKSPKFKALAESTQDSYYRDLEIVRQQFGSASVQVMHDLRFRGDIVAWHEKLAASSPRGADRALTVLRNALDHATRRGQLLHNPAAELQTAYVAPDDKRPWSADDIRLFLQGDPEKGIGPAPQDVSDIFHVGLYTALRRTDVVALTWAAVGTHEIQWQTSKSRRRRTVIIPLTAEAQAFFADLKRRQQIDGPLGLQRTVITGAHGKSLTPNAIQKKVNERARALGLDNTFHRLRNTYATLLVSAGFKPFEIAGIMGWTEHDVHELTRIYVKRDEIVQAQIIRLREARKS